MNQDYKRHKRKMAARKRRLKRISKSTNKPHHRPSIETEAITGFDRSFWSKSPVVETKPIQPSLTYFDTAAWNRHEQNSK